MAMLTTATLGMLLWGLYSAAWAAVDVVRGARLEWWAEAGQVVFGLLLTFASALVRVRWPGGLALAVGGLLGLQSLAVHSAVHVDFGVVPQAVQGAFGVALVVLALLAPVSPRSEDRPT
jgi:hypothetical protein